MLPLHCCLGLASAACQQHFFPPTHFHSTYLFTLFWERWVGEGEPLRHLSSQCLLTSMHVLKAQWICVLTQILLLGSLHGGVSIVWSAGTSVRRCGLSVDGVSGCVLLGTRRWEGSSTPIYLVSLCSSCAPTPHTHTASPLPGSGLACVAHCFQNEITLSHGENKSPRLYRQVSLKVFEEDLQGSSLMDDIGGKYEHQCLSIF